MAFLFVAMDPAGPSYNKADTAARLDVYDALYIEILHTNGDSFWSIGNMGLCLMALILESRINPKAITYCVVFFNRCIMACLKSFGFVLEQDSSVA